MRNQAYAPFLHKGKSKKKWFKSVQICRRNVKYMSNQCALMSFAVIFSFFTPSNFQNALFQSVNYSKMIEIIKNEHEKTQIYSKKRGKILGWKIK
jgi:hypothetical protein